MAIGDTISDIADRFGISINTILWENNLTARSFIRPGDKLRILPVSGLKHVVKRGDTLKRISVTYGVKTEDIIKYNKLKESGSDLIAGESIIIPEGVKSQQIAVNQSVISSIIRRAAPPPSRQSPTVSGFVWPTAARVITQYFSWRHQGIDIAGGTKSTPIYAAKGGAVTTAQCGWNAGWGCYIMIDHGNGVRTQYAHNTKLLVSVGDTVQAGQTIALMGNTGRVRGRTGIHLDFRIYINGNKTTVNPLGYVR